MGSNGIIDKELLIELLDKNKIECTDSVLLNIESVLTKELGLFVKQISKKKPSEEYSQGVPVLDNLSESEINSIPSWCKKDIEKARLIGNSKKTVEMPDGRRYHLNNKLNHMSGSEWTYFINSVMNTNYSTYGEEGYAYKIRKIHPTPKPPQLMKEIIQFFTKENEIVFDYFMGVGGSLLGASLCGRRAVGIDLNPEYIIAYKKAASELNLVQNKCYVGNSIELLKNKDFMDDALKNEKASLILLDPPYSNMMSKEKTGGDISVYGKVATPFTEDKEDLGNMDRNEFLQKLKLSMELAEKYLKNHGHIVVFIKDLQPHKKETNLLHAEVINKINEIANINYKGLKIWADQSAKLFPYGYPFSFVANQIHQYILVFRKEY